MKSLSDSAPRMVGPEQFLHRVLLELRNHVLWDTLLLLAWPLLAGLYGAAYLYRIGWLDELTLSAVTILLIASGALALLLRYRPGIPSQSSAATKVDQLTHGQDRFITLATLEPGAASPELLSRLRREAMSLESRIAIKRDFPYRAKRSFYISLVVSILGAALFHLWPLAYSALRPVSAPQHIRELAEKMVQSSQLAELAKNFRVLADKLENANSPPQEQQQLIKTLEEQVAAAQNRIDQRETDSQKKQQDSDLLSDASATLNSLEQQFGKGREQQKEDGAGGNLQNNLPQENKGENKPAPGGEGEGKGESNAQPTKDMQQGQSGKNDAQRNSPEKTAQNSKSTTDTKSSQPDPSQSGAEKNDQSAVKAPQVGEDKGGKIKASGDIPQGAPPAERFNQGGEGPGSLKNARYIEVRLPEEVFGAEKGESVGTKASKNNRVGARLPVSNAPLPPQLPDAPAEKQPMPLEYRGIIR